MRSSPMNTPSALARKGTFHFWTLQHETSPYLSLLRVGIERLQSSGVEQARQEAEWLLSQLVGVPRLELYLERAAVSPQTIKRFFAQVEARCCGVPLQYVLREAQFFGERFTVAPGVFIPRPETETMVDAALKVLRPKALQSARPLRLLDLGTGSGCIALTLARSLPACLVVGVELSWTALQVAADNVRRHRLTSQVQLVHSWWLEALRGPFDALVANPPYVPSAQVDRLPLDVRHEPRMSLDGGDDGMRDLRHLMAQAPNVLAPGGLAVFECGENQVSLLVDAAHAASWVASVIALEDLAQRPRGVLIHRT